MTPLRSTPITSPVLIADLPRPNGHGSIQLQVRRHGRRMSAQLTLLVFIDGRAPLCEHILANHLLDVPDSILLAEELSQIRFPCGVTAAPTLVDTFFASFPET